MKRYQQLAELLVRQIDQGLYRPGDKLPSIRDLSHEHGTSITTVQSAYRLLEDQGRAEARHKSGFYVRPQARLARPQQTQPVPRPLEVAQWEEVLDLLSEVRPLHALGSAIPDLTSPTLNPLLQLQQRVNRFSRQDSLSYGPIRGFEELRREIARMATASGSGLHPDELIITCSCQEALAVSLKVLTEPGDIVAIDSPSYYGVTQLIRSLGLKALEIPTHPETGISLEALELALEQWPIKVILVTPTANNPLGYSMPESKKRGLLQLAQRFDLPLIEDDIYGDLSYAYPRPASIKSFDRDGRVLLVSSFSKTIAPGLRIGWVAPGRYNEQVLHQKYVTSGWSPSQAQLALAEFIGEGHYQRHLRQMRQQYRQGRDRTLHWLAQYLPADTKVSHPDGGFLLWVELDSAFDSLALNRRLQEHNLSIAPGVLFSASGKYRHCFRLNCTQITPERERALALLGRTIEALRTEA